VPKKPASSKSRSDLIRSITTPLGFFVLAVIIVEATLGIVLSASKLDNDHVWFGFLWMVVIFIGVVLIVTGLTVFYPKNLLYGKEEYVSPPLDSSALNDAIGDLIVANVKSDCLKNPLP
jgi:heme A synthase